MNQTKQALANAWIGLVVLSILSFVIAASSGIGPVVETLIVIVVAAMKGRVILVWFMGARSFPPAWRVFFNMWLLVNAVVIVGFTW
ncbi:cytochrome C oxidase subunit IV family protein [Mycobacterium sp.]|uniref:cytochrome C oxidase subunit IV family protein n=1 Tax=Mycobacterium sp. TaxID=1785 RepID=UPI003D131B17